MRILKVALLTFFLSTVIFGVFAFKELQRPPATKDQVLLSAITQIIESKHYSPQKIDDALSAKIFNDYLDILNPDKDIFLQEDISALAAYKNKLDDEIKGDPIQFYKKAAQIYFMRMDEVIADYRQLLTQPFDYTVNETVSFEDEKEQYANSIGERKETWRKKLKYSALDRYVDLLEQKEKNKGDTAFDKPDTQLKEEANRKLMQMLDRNYNRQKLVFNEQEQFNAYLNVIVNLMDPHTEYFPPIEKRAFDEEMTGRFYGIGAQLKDDDGAIKIASLMTGSPAWKSGDVLVNDEIIKVAQGKNDPVDVRGYAVTDAVKLIRGGKGTEVRLTMRSPDGSTKIVTIIRDEIVQDEQFARSAVITKNGIKTGYIYLPEFYADYDRPDGNKCSQDVAKEIVKLKKENVSGIIMDLRNNGGGSLNEVVQMVGLFIKSGPVVQVSDKDSKANILNDRDESILYDGPLTVMVNEFSASASEIFAAAIQDYGRGIIVGSATYGKGTVQRPIPLGKVDYNTGQTEYGSLKITFEKFYRINGGSTQLKGVTPDIALPDAYDYLKLREKDRTSALPWDQIEKAKYIPFMAAPNRLAIIQASNEAVQSNQNFTLLKDNINWLQHINNRVYNLNIDSFKSAQVLTRKTIQQNDNLTNLTTPLSIVPPQVDYEKYYNNADKTKGDRYLDWLKRVQRDIYIDQAVDITAKLKM